MSLFDAFVSSATGKKKSNNQTTVEPVTWQCRYCGRVCQTSPLRIPNAVGTCRVIAGKGIPHEWMRVY